MRIFRRLWIRFRINRLSLKDYLVNFYLRLRFQYIRLFNSKKLRHGSTIDKHGYELVFNDEFDRNSWSEDNRKWIVGEHWGMHHPNRLNVHYGEPKLLKSNTETAALFTVKHNPKTFNRENKKITIPFEVSLLSSNKTFQQQYGRFECRMTLPKGRGVWPAFWMWGPTWPPEIDVIEAYGDRNGLDTRFQEINIHYGHDSQNNRSNMRPWIIKVDNKKGVGKKYHEFAVEWHPNKIEFFTDGIKVFQYTNKKMLNRWFNKPETNMWIVINNSLRQGFIDDNDVDFYSEFKVDYIRAYKFL